MVIEYYPGTFPFIFCDDEGMKTLVETDVA